jgi:hypothetical protein
MITINFATNINNDSLQIGDLAYFVTPSSVGGFEQSTATPTLIGSIEVITADSIDVDETIGDGVPGQDDFIMFAKDSSINISGLVGYYAGVKIKNNSTDRAEMFTIASGITPSSK